MNVKKHPLEDDATALVVGREPGFEWVLRRMPGIVYRCAADRELTMSVLTHGIADLLGYPPGEFVDNSVRSYASVIHEDEREAVVDRMRQILARGSPQPEQVEYWVVTADGRERWVQQRAWVVRDDQGQPACLEGFIFDITEYRLLQLAELERHAAYERQQRALVALATSSALAEGRLEELAALVTPLVTEAVAVERSAVWMFNSTRTKLELVDLYRRTDGTHERGGMVLAAAEFPIYFEAMSSGRTVDAHDAVSDPRTREFADRYLRPRNIHSMLDAAIRVGAEVVGIVCLEHVGGPRRWLEHEIEFASEVADQISLALLNRARLDAQAREQHLQDQLLHAQKMDALGRLAGGVAHDFNNLLMVIGGSAELLEMRLDDPSLRSSAQDIIAATGRAGELIEQLRSFSRQEPLAREPLDLGALVARLEPMLRRVLGRGVRLWLSVPEEPVVVHATEGLIQQALTNLVVNARDAVRHDRAEPGVVDVTVEVVAFAEPVTDLPEAVPVGRYASVCVSDDGVGMSAEVQAQAFEPFFTTKPVGEGTGLGLATVYSIAKRCEGMVRLVSEVGVGTRVYLLLPIAA